jgi:hypothetical protein
MYSQKLGTIADPVIACLSLLSQALVSQLQSPNVVRRKGAAGAIRNCCMSAEEDSTLQHIISDEVVLERILQPLSATEPIEKDSTVRSLLAEAVAVLAKSEEARKALWGVKAPDMLKKGYEFEESHDVCAAMEAAARLFMFDGKVGDDEEDDSPPALILS